MNQNFITKFQRGPGRRTGRVGPDAPPRGIVPGGRLASEEAVGRGGGDRCHRRPAADAPSSGRPVRFIPGWIFIYLILFIHLSQIG